MMPKPTEQEILKWFLHTAVHAFHVEYYLQRLQIGSEDPDRPHDIVHTGNKFEWEAVRGLALRFREGAKEVFHQEHQESLNFHRQQYHHQKWNQYYPHATEDAMRLGAVDAVCSLLEPREYQGGVHTFDEILKIAESNPIHKIAWLKLAVIEMRLIERPNLEEIKNFSKIPRQGISTETHDTILERIYEGLCTLEKEQEYRFNL